MAVIEVLIVKPGSSEAQMHPGHQVPVVQPVVPSSLISTDPGNKLVIGSDGRLSMPGDGSGSGALSMVAGISLGGHRVVVHGEIGVDAYADPMDSGHINKIAGITLGSAVAGDFVSVMRFGEITESTWSWVPDLPIYLGLNGVLTQSMPEQSAFVQVIGCAISATKISVSVRDPIAIN